ncbi:MAG: PD-(D/E)XK nuclease family protein, partial [Ktedonobacteraceae bacterium]
MNKTSPSSFNWCITQGSLWPPRGRPNPPFGPTGIEMMRSCTLRVCFDASKGYERRTDYAARVGIAFHKTLQSLAEQPIQSSVRGDIIEEATRRFRHEISLQEEQKNLRIREMMFPRDEERVSRAFESIVREALRLAKQLAAGSLKHGTYSTTMINKPHLEVERNSSEELLVEVPVQSRDKLLAGRVDYAERLPSGGIRLLDYKSALRNDLPERYERQLQLYALLWNETFDEWPIEGWVSYPFTGAMHKVSIDPETCQQVDNEARLLIQRLREDPPVDQLASPGDVCSVCEFRPWCKPFWAWQAKHINLSEALQNAYLGFEGKITTIELKDYFWIVKLKWRDTEIRIVAPEERF